MMHGDFKVYRCTLCFECSSVVECSLLVDPLSYSSFQPELYNWCNKGHGVYYPVCEMVHIKDSTYNWKK